MKQFLLAGTFLVFMAVVAEAQVTFEYNRRTRNSSLSITYSGYSYSGYGYGGYGYGGYGYSGMGYGLGGFPGGYGYADSFYTGYGLYSFGTPYGLYGGGRSSYYEGPLYRYPSYPHGYAGVDTSPAPRTTPGVADRAHEYTSARQIEDGRRRFRMGDYRGAVDDFRAAVAAHTGNGLAQAYFAVGLVVIGDTKNADKALRAAVELQPFGKVELKGLFRDDRERVRILGLLAKVSGDGTLAAAYAQSLLGESDRLKQLAEKDPMAKKLLGN